MWDFIQNQLLGMKWLNVFIGDFLTACGMDVTGRMGGGLQFFIFDTLKIFILLSVLIFIISYVQSYFPPERTKKLLGRYRGVRANCLSALLGTVTPFCSCSSIPLFMGFTRAGLPIGVTFSFLISSPLVDLGSLILLMSVFGWRVAVVYVVVGLVLAVMGGTLIEKLRMECYIENFTSKSTCGCSSAGVQGEAQSGVQAVTQSVAHGVTKRVRLRYAWVQLVATVKKVFWYVIVGVGIGALIHNWIPILWIETLLGEKNPFSVIIATIVGIPMYADIFGAIPIAEALFAKGVGIGTVLSFMMAVTALSLPSIIMLKKVVKTRLLVLFVVIVAIGIILIGYLFNALQFLFV